MKEKKPLTVKCKKKPVKKINDNAHKAMLYWGLCANSTASTGSHKGMRDGPRAYGQTHA